MNTGGILRSGRCAVEPWRGLPRRRGASRSPPVQLVYHWKWELSSPRLALWPLVADTQRVNEAVGLGPWSFESLKDPRGGTRRLGKASFLGMKLEWDEHPFEWVIGRELGVQRVYRSGPVAEVTSKVRLTSTAAGGTLLEHTLVATPSNAAAGMLTRIEMGVRLKRAFDRVYRQLDEEARASGPAVSSWDATARLVGFAVRERAEGAIERLVKRGFPRERCQRLLGFVLEARPREVDRIR